MYYRVRNFLLGVKLNIFEYSLNHTKLPAMLEIINLDGETLYKRKFTKKFEDLDTTKIPHGVYFVKIQRKDSIETMKLFVS